MEKCFLLPSCRKLPLPEFKVKTWTLWAASLMAGSTPGLGIVASSTSGLSCATTLRIVSRMVSELSRIGRRTSKSTFMCTAAVLMALSTRSQKGSALVPCTTAWIFSAGRSMQGSHGSAKVHALPPGAEVEFPGHVQHWDIPGRGA